MTFYLSLVIFSAVLFSTNSVKLPLYFERCSIDDPQLGECIKNSANAGISEFVKGDNKIHVVNMVPLHVEEMFIDVNGGLTINLTNCDIFGLDTARLVVESWDAGKKRAESTVQIDYTSLVGEYDINGRILILPITGSGPCNITFVRPTFKFFFDYELETKNGIEYIKITNTGLTYETERAYFKLFNLFGGNGNLADTMLAFLDDNWREVNDEIGARVGDAFALVFSNILQNFFYRVPYSEMFNL